MTEVQSDIELHFGGASTEERWELINKRAINFDVSIERVLIVDFEDMFNDVWMRAGRENIFELLILIATGKNVYCKNVSIGTYTHNGSRYPKVVIHGDYLNMKDSGERLWINDETVNFIGKELDANFDYEFVEFLRIKQ
jgi:hypothetical protein